MSPRDDRRTRWTTLAPTALALSLAVGWAWRESVFAKEQEIRAASGTINLEQVKMGPLKDKGEAVGTVGVYVAGDTPASSKFVTGRVVLDAGKTPHAPHTHVEEEVMVIEAGHGDLFCDGRTTKVGPGSVMFTTPNAPHGIVNTGDTPLTFYFIKWTSKDGK